MTKLSDYNARAVGIAWIRKEDYPSALSVFEDGAQFFPLWEQWEESAKKTEKTFKDQGYIVERVYIDPDTFGAWCRVNGFSTGRDGRGNFAAAIVAEKYGRDQS